MPETKIENCTFDVPNTTATVEIIHENFLDSFGTKQKQSLELTKETKDYQPEIYKQFTGPELSNLVVSETLREGEAVVDGRWSVHGDVAYTRSNPIADKLATGVYRTVTDMAGTPYLIKQKMLADALLTLPDDASTEILQHIKEFWGLRDRFRQFGFLHKRGVLLYGPQGSGKTSTIIQTIKAITEQGGVVFLGGYPGTDTKGIQMFRRLEPDRPLVVVYEDVDDTVYYYGDKALTELLDGEANVDNVLFLATTNHPERLPARLINRPSRFDVLKLIGMPSEAARHAYLMAKTDLAPSEIGVWAQKTEGLSISHLKELLILVLVLEKQLDESISHLKGMRRIPNSRDFGTELG